MPACFEARSDDDIHAGFFKCCTLVGRCCRSNRDDAFRAALL